MEKKVKLNQSVQKCFSIIEIMAENQKSMKLQDICSVAQVPDATGLRMLYTLQSLGYVVQDEETLKYSLTFKFELISSSVRNNFDLRTTLRPYLEEISNKHGQAVSLSINNENKLLYIDSIDSKDSILSLAKRIGKIAPLYCTGAGKLYMSRYSESELKDYCEKNELKKLTVNTITSINELAKEMEIIRKQGYALDNEECEIGVMCVSVPILSVSGEIVASMSVSMPTSAIGVLDSIKEDLLEISSKLKNNIL